MAFVRWRGKCAQLLTTIYTDKGSKQLALANLPEFRISLATRREVERNYPDLKLDWIKIARTLAKGPPEMKEKIPDEHMDMAEVEEHLRKWAAKADRETDANRLYMAADALMHLRARLYHANE
jgi:hypothetical protein